MKRRGTVHRGHSTGKNYTWEQERGVGGRSCLQIGVCVGLTEKVRAEKISKGMRE